MPILSHQDVTYHFRVSQSVSRLSLRFGSSRPDLLSVCLTIVSFLLLGVHLLVTQAEVSCDSARETSSYSDYHFLVQSQCI